jgi:hypothetical protein
MWFRPKPNSDRPRRVYYNERVGLGRGYITAYLIIEEWRSGDNWHEASDRLRQVVRKELLQEAPYITIGSISLHDVWAAIVPSVCPSHWITAGFRSTEILKAKTPIIQIPVSIGTTDSAIRDIGGVVFFAIDALPYPDSLDISSRDRAVFSVTLLSALSIAVRDQMRAQRRAPPMR